MTAAEETEDSVWNQRAEGDRTFCCPLGFGAGQALEGFWRGVFGRVRPGARLLEIGCGSGQVSVWAAEAHRGLTITASDIHHSADAVGRHPDVTFRGGVRAEALPFPDSAFDLVVSNFGFEYADPALAAPELARVVALAGGAVLVVHRTDSDVSASSRLMIEIAGRLDQAGIAAQLRRAAALKPEDPSRGRLLKQVLDARAGIPTAPFNFSGPEYFALAERLAGGEAVEAAEIEAIHRGVAMRLAMAREQARAALDLAGLRTLLGRFHAAGLRAEASEVTATYEDGRVERIGWVALLARPAG